MEDLPEWKTRLEKIDVQLEKAGWLLTRFDALMQKTFKGELT